MIYPSFKIELTPFWGGIFLAIISSSFLLWRRLKEDYPQEKIFQLTLLIAGLSSLLAFAAKTVLKVGIFGAFGGAILGAVLWTKKEKLNTWEVLDALSLGLVLFFLFGGGSLFLTNWNYFNLGFAGVGIGGLLVFLFVRKRYRSFSWYKSGKTGFIFWAVSFFVFLLLFILDFFSGRALYLRKVLSLIIVAFSAGIIYYRSERKLRQDVGFLAKRRKDGKSSFSD